MCARTQPVDAIRQTFKKANGIMNLVRMAFYEKMQESEVKHCVQEKVCFYDYSLFVNFVYCMNSFLHNG